MAAPGGAKGGVPRSFVSPESRELLPRAKLVELLQEVAPGETLDADVEEFLQEHADEFVESVTLAACRLARHRKSKTLDARDVALHLSRSWSLRVPGYGDDPRPAGRGAGAAGGGLGSLAATGAGGGAAGRGAGGGLAGGLTVEGVAAGHAARLAAVAKAAATANKGGVGGAGGGK